jgi:hypothetical protein
VDHLGVVEVFAELREGRQTGLKILTRVTRVGEFSSKGRLFTLGSFLNVTKVCSRKI